MDPDAIQLGESENDATEPVPHRKIQIPSDFGQRFLPRAIQDFHTKPFHFIQGRACRGILALKAGIKRFANKNPAIYGDEWKRMEITLKDEEFQAIIMEDVADQLNGLRNVADRWTVFQIGFLFLVEEDQSTRYQYEVPLDKFYCDILDIERYPSSAMLRMGLAGDQLLGLLRSNLLRRPEDLGFRDPVIYISYEVREIGYKDKPTNPFAGIKVPRLSYAEIPSTVPAFRKFMQDWVLDCADAPTFLFPVAIIKELISILTINRISWLDCPDHQRVVDYALCLVSSAVAEVLEQAAGLGRFHPFYIEVVVPILTSPASLAAFFRRSDHVIDEGMNDEDLAAHCLVLCATSHELSRRQAINPEVKYRFPETWAQQGFSWIAKQCVEITNRFLLHTNRFRRDDLDTSSEEDTDSEDDSAGYYTAEEDLDDGDSQGEESLTSDSQLGPDFENTVTGSAAGSGSTTQLALSFPSSSPQIFGTRLRSGSNSQPQALGSSDTQEKTRDVSSLAPPFQESKQTTNNQSSQQRLPEPASKSVIPREQPQDDSVNIASNASAPATTDANQQTPTQSTVRRPTTIEPGEQSRLDAFLVFLQESEKRGLKGSSEDERQDQDYQSPKADAANPRKRPRREDANIPVSLSELEQEYEIRFGNWIRGTIARLQAARGQENVALSNSSQPGSGTTSSASNMAGPST